MDKLTKKSSPRVSMGTRLTPREPERWACGPGSYAMRCGVGQLSPTMKSAPASSFGRSSTSWWRYEDEARGPGHYELPNSFGSRQVNRRSSTAVTMRSRTPRREYGPGGQGPGLCRRDSFLDPRSAPNKRAAPRFSIGVRTSQKTSPSPGPGAHFVSSGKRRSGPAYTMGGRVHTASLKPTTDIGPGRCREDSSIGAQAVSTQKNYPAFSFGLRCQPKKETDFTPGPGAYG